MPAVRSSSTAPPGNDNRNPRSSSIPVFATASSLESRVSMDDAMLSPLDSGECPVGPEPAPPLVEVVEQVTVKGKGPFTVQVDSTESKVDYLGERTKGNIQLNYHSGSAGSASSGSATWTDLEVPVTSPQAKPFQESAPTFPPSSFGWQGVDWDTPAAAPLRDPDLVNAEEAESMMHTLGIPAMFPDGLPSRGIFCSRTLNLRSITTIGYDMDYTLIHYNVNAWEGRAYEYAKENLRSRGFPVEGLKFDPNLVIRGLVIDKRNGNIVKADRFGLVKRATHGSSMLSQRAISELYGRELVDLRNEARWEFLNTLFSVSEAVIYLQMVDRLDAGLLPLEIAPNDYVALYQAVSKALFRAHVEGQLKAEIINEPEKFVELDPELPLALLDQKESGKRLLVITNSDYTYTNRMMTHAFDRFLPGNMTWRNLFDMVIVSARKPEFFSMTHPLYEIVTPDGLMRPCFKAIPGGLYCGGSAQMVEKALGFSGDETLYVGDHIYTDVSQSKLHLRWRTCLICRELENEVEALVKGQGERQRLIALMEEKDRIGDCFNHLRLAFQRRAAQRQAESSELDRLEESQLLVMMKKILKTMERLDQEIAPLLDQDGHHFNKRWGYLCRAGLWDKSHLTRQIEKYADIYTSRVSNFLWYTPFMYFRSQRQLIAHDMNASWPVSSFLEEDAEEGRGKTLH